MTDTMTNNAFLLHLCKKIVYFKLDRNRILIVIVDSTIKKKNKERKQPDTSLIDAPGVHN